MSFDWTSQPLSIQSIFSQFTLPVVIRSAPGFRGSDRPIVLHSIVRVSFAYGRALKAIETTPKEEYGSHRPIDSETVAIPIGYPGYFECLPSRHIKQPVGVVPETNLSLIVKRMETDQRSQAFYLEAPIRAYTIESNPGGISHRQWHQIASHQMILFDRLVHVEYSPTEDDDLTDADYSLPWWLCFGKQILNRNEYALKCIILQQHVCYIPCSSTDEIKLIPVGQHGSSNINKLQAIHNLMEQFPLPVNVKLAQLPGAYAYRDFPGSAQLLGSRADNFAICASLSSTNIAAIPTNTPLKFVVAPIPSASPEIQKILSACLIFKQSFDMQIRRILIFTDHDTSSHRSRSRHPKIQEAIDKQLRSYKRSYSIEQNSNIQDDPASTTTDEGYRSTSAAAKRRNYSQQSQTITIDNKNSSHPSSTKRTTSTNHDATYSSIGYRLPAKQESSSSSPAPPALPKKPPNFPYPARSPIFDSNSNIIDAIDRPDAEGAILMDASNELFLALPSESRFT